MILPSRKQKIENRKKREILGFGLILFSIFNFLLHAIQPVAADEKASPITFTLVLADGSRHSGKVGRIAENWSIRIDGDKVIEPGGSEIVSLRRDRLSNLPMANSEQVFLANGDRLPASVRELGGDRLRIHGDLGKDSDYSVPLAAVSMIWITAPDGIDRPNHWRRRLLAEKRSRDNIYLQNGEIIEGVVNSVSDKNVQIESAKKDLTVSLGKIALIALNTELVRNPQPPQGIHGRLLSDNGMRLTLVSAVADGLTLTGKTPYGVEFSIPLNRVKALNWLGGCAQYLSDLKPRSHQFRSYLEDFDWPYVKDASVTEGDLRLGGQLFDKGLGVHTASRLTFMIPAEVRAFESVVGMDDLYGKEGSAQVQVLLDGKPQKLGWDGRLVGGGKPQSIRLPISGAKEITLVADFGVCADVQGCVDWADARLIKNPK
jgi:hypothetical protein